MKMKSQPFKVGDMIQFLSRGDIDEDIDIGFIMEETKYPVTADERAWEVYFFDMNRTFTIYEREMILISRVEHEQEKEKA